MGGSAVVYPVFNERDLFRSRFSCAFGRATMDDFIVVLVCATFPRRIRVGVISVGRQILFGIPRKRIITMVLKLTC